MKKILLLGMAALLMAGISSCSGDELTTDVNDAPLERDQSFFANIAISNTDVMTRADAPNSKPNDYDYDSSKDPNFDVGNEYENQINSIYLIFYDREGFRVATTQVRKDINASLNGNEYNTGYYIYKGIVQVDVKHGSNKPAYVMCFINPITSSNFEINPDFETLASLQSTTRPRIIDDNNYFAMSKSVYFGIDRNANDGNDGPSAYKKIIATPLTYGANLFDTESQAQAAIDAEDGKGVVDIYVERYAAKVNLSIAKKENLKIDLDNDYILKFTPEYWAVNAYEENTYICKSFLSTDGKQDLSYLDLIKAFGGTDYTSTVWKWNNPDYHRCYWAQSPAYYAADYPRVADDIKDNGEEAYALRYYSYNDMVKNAEGKLISKARKFDGDNYTAIYARENTVAGYALAGAYKDPSASPKAAIASAVIVGSYKLFKKEGETEKEITMNDGEMFYIAGNKVNGYTVYENTAAMTDFFIQTTIPFYTDTDGTTFFDYTTGNFKAGLEKYKNCFKIMHPTAAARKGLVIDSRYVTIQLNTDAIKEDTPLYVYLDGRYVQVTKANVDEVNKQMLYAAGTVQAFNGGKVFYNIPIKHLGFYRSDNANKGMSGSESTFDWTKVQSGDFGLVRNHSYSIVVDKIEGLGNGIPNPEDPIVPPTDPEEYYIGARIIVLNWAVVPEQHVTL